MPRGPWPRTIPNTAFLIGSSFKPDAAVANFSVFDNYIQDASYLTGMIAGSVTKKGNIGMVGGYPIPEVNRLMNAFMKGVDETNARRQVPGRLHRLAGSIRRRPRRRHWRRSMPVPT